VFLYTLLVFPTKKVHRRMINICRLPFFLLATKIGSRMLAGRALRRIRTRISAVRGAPMSARQDPGARLLTGLPRARVAALFRARRALVVAALAAFLLRGQCYNRYFLVFSPEKIGSFDSNYGY
jgi:hypothetical protein